MLRRLSEVTRRRSGKVYAAGGLEPSVAQPPLPLQLFLPLQPLSPALQPPLPLQSFLPLQECLSLSAATKEAEEKASCPNCAPLWLVDAWIGVAEPLSKPLTAALNIIAFMDVFIRKSPFMVMVLLRG